MSSLSNEVPFSAYYCEKKLINDLIKGRSQQWNRNTMDGNLHHS